MGLTDQSSQINALPSRFTFVDTSMYLLVENIKIKYLFIPVTTHETRTQTPRSEVFRRQVCGQCLEVTYPQDPPKNIPPTT